MSLELIKRLADYLKSYRSDIFIVLVSLIAVSSALLGLGYSFRYLVDYGLSSGDESAVSNVIGMICIIILIFAVSSFFRSFFINNIAEKVCCSIREDAFKSLMKLDITAFEDLKVADVVTRLTSDIELINKLIIDFLSFFVRNSVLTIGSLALMFSQAPKLALIVLIVVPLLLAPIIGLGKYVRALSKKSLAAQSEMACSIEEDFVNVKTLYAFNQQANKISQFAQMTKSYLKTSKTRLKVRSLFFAISISMVLSAITLVIWMGSQDIVSGRMSSGALVSFIYYAITAGMSIGGIAELMSELQKPLAGLERVFSLVATKSDLGHIQIIGEKTSFRTDRVITFKNINFSYPSRPEVLALNNLSLEIKTGAFTGIVGKSGSGKSTLFQLLLKFYHLSDGQIYFDKTPIDQISPELLRHRIAYVPQDPSIFSGTIRSNIALSRPDASDHEIEEISEMVGINTFARDLTAGLDTEIGERGVRLSGGQRQRIAIARALLYRPEILLLDEATSNLDVESEEDIINQIVKNMSGKTIISIAHRISTIEKAERVIVIEQGSVSASGTHEELLERSSLYKSMYNEES